MRYSLVSVIITILFVCLLSCREAIGEKHDSRPKETTTPRIPPKKTNRQIQKDTVTQPSKKRQNNKTKERKKRASDTLKPKMALLR